MLPLLFEAGIHTCSTGPNDGYGPTTVYTPPRESSGTVAKVYGWRESSSIESRDLARLVITDVELLAPPGFSVGPFDLVDLPYGQYEVIGYPEDYNHGPFGFAPGVLVKLRRVQG